MSKPMFKQYTDNLSLLDLLAIIFLFLSLISQNNIALSLLSSLFCLRMLYQVFINQQSQQQHIGLQYQLKKTQDNYLNLIKAIKKIGAETATLHPIDHDLESLSPLVNSINQLLNKYHNLLNIIQTSGIVLTSSKTELKVSLSKNQQSLNQQREFHKNSLQFINHITTEFAKIQLALHAIDTVQQQHQDDLMQNKQVINQFRQFCNELTSFEQTVAKKTLNLPLITQQLARISSIIIKLASQANLLSINATIEAQKIKLTDHAFNVVANDIRKLAEQSAVISQDINIIISTLHNNNALNKQNDNKINQLIKKNAPLLVHKQGNESNPSNERMTPHYHLEQMHNSCNHLSSLSNDFVNEIQQHENDYFKCEQTALEENQLLENIQNTINNLQKAIHHPN